MEKNRERKRKIFGPKFKTPIERKKVKDRNKENHIKKPKRN